MNRTSLGALLTVVAMLAFAGMDATLAGAAMWATHQILARLCTRADSADTTLVWSAFVALAATTVVGPWQLQWPDAMLLAGSLYAWHHDRRAASA